MEIAGGDGNCEESLFQDPDDDPTSLSYPDFPPNTDPKAVTYSDENASNLTNNSEQDYGTYYSGFGSVNAVNGQSYFQMQSNQVSCEPVLQFDYCGDNSVYWTTKLDIEGSGELCGASNMFWRSGWCSCPQNPNVSFWAGFLDGQVSDNYTNVVNKSTVYSKKIKSKRKTSQNKDVILISTDEVGNLVSSNVYGGPGEDAATSITTIIPSQNSLVNNSGGFAITGYFDKTIDFSGDGSEKLSSEGVDAFVTLFSSDGTHIKSGNNFIEAYEAKGKAIICDSDGNFILVLSIKETAQDQNGSTVIMKLDAELEIIWQKVLYGGTHEIDPGNIVVGDKNGVVITGSFNENLSIQDNQLQSNPEMHSMFAIGINKNGSVIWFNSFGESDAPIIPTAIDNSPNNSLYISGYFTDDIIRENGSTLIPGNETSSFIVSIRPNAFT